MANILSRVIVAGILFAGLLLGRAQAEVYNPRNYDADMAAGQAQVQSTCKKAKNGMACRIEAREKLEAAGRVRGTQAYVDKHYKPLGAASLVVKYRELEGLQKTARTSLMNVKPGEVTYSDYESEMNMLVAEHQKRTGKPILPADCESFKAAPGFENDVILKKTIRCK